MLKGPVGSSDKWR
jgi:hypothetical protein